MADIYVNSKCKTALFDFKVALKSILKEVIFSRKFAKKEAFQIIILCIGTDKATGDSLGPLIGHKLSRLPKKKNVFIYGTLKEPVHAINLKKTIDEIYSSFDKPIIIAIDASLGKTEHIGCITVSKGSLRPGAGVNKNLGEIGDVAITGIVNINGFLQMAVLQSTRLCVVMDIADIVSLGIWSILNSL